MTVKMPKVSASEDAMIAADRLVSTMEAESGSTSDNASRSSSARGNVGDVERKVSLAAGGILALIGLGRRDLTGLLIAGVGGGLIYRGVSGQCPMYQSLGINTAEESEAAQYSIHVEQAFLINRSPEDLYNYWRNFENLPNIMSHLKSVTTTGGNRSRWVADAPGIVGGEVTWEAETTQDLPNQLIAWQSVPGSEVTNSGAVRFSPAMGDRGTEVHVFLNYSPPAGRLGHWVAKLFGKAPDQQIREDLRKFKRVMEVGEAPTVDGRSHGTCHGMGSMLRRAFSGSQDD
jgi:uncharacterized membrane protein